MHGLLQEVCCNVTVEPSLLPLNGETIAPVSANCTDEACADVWATRFWDRHQDVFFDRRVHFSKAQVGEATGIW